VEQEEVAIARQQCSKYISAATDQHTTIEELMEAVFSVCTCMDAYAPINIRA
jgi:hypothetical protein